MTNKTQDENAEFCECCCYEPDCPWYKHPRLEYVGDELDAILTQFHNVRTNDNAVTGNNQSCIYNTYLLEKDMGLTDMTFEEWEQSEEE